MRARKGIIVFNESYLLQPYNMHDDAFCAEI